MNKDLKLLLYISVIAFLVGACVGAVLGHWTKKCPEIITGSETTETVIALHDTIRDTVSVIKILREKSRAGSTSCYMFESDPEDGAHIQAKVCSDSLPLNDPSLYGEISYTAPPDTTKIISRVDTVINEVEKPRPKTLLGVMTGIIIALTIALFTK